MIANSLVNAKLNEVMNEFGGIYRNNINSLLIKISPHEIWRYFIELERQDKDRTLLEELENIIFLSSIDKSLVPPEFQPFLIEAQDLNLSVTSFIKKYPIYEEKIILLIGNDLKDSKEKYDKLTANNFIKKQRGWAPFEIRERNYLKGVILAFNYLIENLKKGNTELSAEFIAFIQKLHSIATSDVKNTNYDSPDLDGSMPVIGKFRSNPLRISSFPLSRNNTTLAGLTELIERIKLNISPAQLYLIDSNLKQEQKIDFNDPTNTAEKLFSEYCTLLSTKSLEVRGFHEDDNLEEHLTRKIKTYIDEFNISIKNADNNYEKIKAIVTFIQACEQTHPFADANCRTFCMLVTMYLCMTNGFPPPLLTNANRFDAYAVEQLIEEVVLGMERTIKLSQGILPCKVTTNTLIEEDLSEEEKNYFFNVIDILKLNNVSLPKISSSGLSFLINNEEKQTNFSTEEKSVVFKN